MLLNEKPQKASITQDAKVKRRFDLFKIRPQWVSTSLKIYYLVNKSNADNLIIQNTFQLCKISTYWKPYWKLRLVEKHILEQSLLVFFRRIDQQQCFSGSNYPFLKIMRVYKKKTLINFKSYLFKCEKKFLIVWMWNFDCLPLKNFKL